MCHRRIAYKKIFVLLNSPVGSSPYIVKIMKSTPYLERMYETNRDATLSKRDIERLREMPACGPRYSLLPYSLEENFFQHTNEPNGPDVTDMLTWNTVVNHAVSQGRKPEDVKYKPPYMA